jgi:hypothetical protein
LSIVLLCFPNADDIVKATFRNAVLSLYAITIAIPITPERHSSVEIKVILHGFVNVLFISSFALMCFRPVLRTWRHIAALAGTFPLEAWITEATTHGIFNPQCGEFDNVRKVSLGSNDVPLYAALWGISVLICAVAVLFLPLVWARKLLPRFRYSVITVTLFLWFCTWVFACVASEVSLGNFNRAPGFGQIMALVMLFSQIWDICYYPFLPSDHGGTRIVYWWKTQAKPCHLRMRQYLMKGMINQITLNLILDSKHIPSAKCSEAGCTCSSQLLSVDIDTSPLYSKLDDHEK